MSSNKYWKCYFGCEYDGVLHRFPNPVHDEDRFILWMNVLDSETQKRHRQYIYNNLRLCNEHFDLCYRVPSGKLTRNAFPTLKLEAECKKRWRSLRDSFIKLQRTHGGRTRWPYLTAMRFLLPHIEPKNEAPAKRETSDSEPEEETPRHRPGFSLPDLSFPDFRAEEEEEDSQPAKKIRLNSTEEQDPCQCNRTDPDELFLLSCAPTLKRLNAKQNAVARLKIQQVLYEAEFGSQTELPYVTPASDCGYENADGSM